MLHDEPTLHDRERFAKAQLDAARKNLDDCHERETIAFEAHQAAIAAVTLALIREDDAHQAWLAAIRANGEPDISP
jgi:phosphoenolpyruvate-protein kinase (PTS system EI component)